MQTAKTFRKAMLCGISALFMAQANAQSSGGLEEVVVTAQKKSENLQTVPISVAALSGEAIEDRAAVTIQSLNGQVPNVFIGEFSNTPNNAVFTIRGIGVIEPDPYAGNTVSIVVDGIPQYFSMGALVDTFDVDRIEVLRGPQGTLFGANTTGGVVNVVTRQPTGETGGRVVASVAERNHYNFGAALDFPIIDGTLAGKVAISHDERDGYVTNVVNGDTMGDRNVTIYRGYLKFTPSDSFDATLMGQYDHIRNGSPIVVAGDLPGEAEYVPPGPTGNGRMYVSPCLPAGSSCDAPDHYRSANDLGIDQSDMDVYRVNLTMNWSDTAIGDITSITGYKKHELLEFTDQDGTPVQSIDTRRPTDGYQFSEELRTTIDVSDSWSMILGGFYMKTHYDHRQDLRIQFALRGVIPGPMGEGFFQANRQEQDNWSGSVFWQNYFDINDKLRLNAGVRWTYEETEMEASVISGIHFAGAPTYDEIKDFDGTTDAENLGAGVVAPPKDKENWDNFGWKLGLDYQITDEVMAYGYWARGFKSGGYTGRIGTDADLGPYDPEEVDTFEIGLKADWLDNRLRTNLALFYTNYRDMQLAQIYFTRDANGNLVQGNTILNAAKSQIPGAELEINAVLAEGLTLNASLAWLKAEYDEFDYALPLDANGNPQGTLDLSGEPLQNAPEWSGNIGLNYEVPVGPGSLRSSVQYLYVGSKFNTSILNTPRSHVQPTKITNVNMDWTPDQGDWTVGIYANNLFDNRYIASVFDAPGTLGLVNYQPPREYGAKVKFSF